MKRELIKKRGLINNNLIKNTFMLYVLAFSNYFFGFITVPYLTRVLGVATYGKIGFATSFGLYVQLILDFGFILSATADIAKNKNNKRELSKILTAVCLCKLFLIFITFICVSFLCISVAKFKADYVLYLLYFAYMSVNSLLPDFLYRGLEKMKFITVRTIMVKLFFTLCIFIFVKNSAQYYLVPVFYLLGSAGAVITVYVDAKKTFNVSFVSVNFRYIKDVFASSSQFFVSRIASSFYTSLNTIILGFVYPIGNILGYYAASDKIITAGKGAITPISDSLYPYMITKRNFSLVKKVLIIGEIVLITGCLFVGIFAEQFCSIMFGADYVSGANILRCMLPLLVLALPTYIIAFPVLTPLGMVKYANASNVLGAIFQSLGIFILYLTKFLNVYSICILTCMTETFVLLIRIWALFKGLKLARNHDDQIVLKA